MSKILKAFLVILIGCDLTASLIFSATFEIKKNVILANNRVVRLADILNSIQCVRQENPKNFQKDGSGSVRLSLNNKKKIHSSSAATMQFSFPLSVEDLKKHRILRYKVRNAKESWVRIFFGDNDDFPQHQAFDDTFMFSGEKEMSLDLDEINFRYIEKSYFPITRLIFRFESLKTKGSPEIELSDVRLEDNILTAPNAVQLQIVRLNGRILESLVFPPGSELVIPLSAESSWKIEGCFGFTQNSNAIYRIFVDGKPIKQYAYRGIGKEWEYFRESFKTSSGRPNTVRLTCSGNDYGFFGNVILSSLPAPGPAPKKVILYLVDALRGDLGGVPFEKLYLAKIFKNGTTFKNAYANATQTSDSLPIIFTGKYKFLLAGDGYDQPLVGDDENTLPKFLKKKGFSTAAFLANPWLLLSNSHKGFDYVYTTWNSRLDDLTNLSGKLPLKIDVPTHNFIKKGKILQEIADFLERNQERSFFIFIHALETHTPYALPVEKMSYSKDTDQDIYRSVFPNEPDFYGLLKTPKQEQIECVKNLYKDNVLDADQSFQELYLLLKNRGLTENLLLILTADHGERLFEHHSWGHGGPDMYNEVLKIPLLMNFPKQLLALVNSAVQSIDLFPTIADWTSDGRFDEKKFLGKSLLRFRDNELKEKRLIFAEGPKKSQFAFIAGAKKVVFSNEKAMAFHLDRDPLEKKPSTLKESGIAAAEIRQMLDFRKNLAKKNRYSRIHSRNTISEEDMKRLKSLGYFNDPD